jgi:N-acetylmuramoyl-L-alanine amidase
MKISKNSLFNYIYSHFLPLNIYLLILFSPVVFADSIDNVRMHNYEKSTRLVIDLDRKHSFSYFLLESPHRVVLDLNDIELNKEYESIFSTLDLTNTPLKRIRFSDRNRGNLRIVFDLKEKLSPEIFDLNSNGRYGYRIVIDFPMKNSKSKNIEKKRDLIIAIDAGHGGRDPGGLGPQKKIYEKNIVLSISKKMKDKLNDLEGYSAFLIRDGDYYVGLSKRREKARNLKADFFVSIHADAFTDSRVSGASVYTLSQSGASSASAKFLADAENNADSIGGVSLSNTEDVLALTLIDLSMTAKIDQSVKAGKAILRELGSMTKLHKKNVEYAGFAVLKTPDIPSVLIETGFISNPREAKLLSTKTHQDRLAAAIVEGIKNFFHNNAPEDSIIYSLSEKKKNSIPLFYKVKYGDTLSEIAVKYSISIDDLREINNLKDDMIRVDQLIKLKN